MIVGRRSCVTESPARVVSRSRLGSIPFYPPAATARWLCWIFSIVPPWLLVRNDPHIDDMMIPRIGEVDLVGSACDIAETGHGHASGREARFDFVVSSHNPEHLPDPVRFLRGCEELLASGGAIAMAVPDKRACFDYFRPCSGTGELLQAFHERRQRPSLAQVFSQGAYASMMQSRSGKSGAFTIDDNPNSIALVGDVVQAYTLWAGRSIPATRCIATRTAGRSHLLLLS